MTERAEPTVSVIMPSFNHARFLTEAIDSVLSQTLPDGDSLELLVMDGGSTDETVATLRSYGERVRWLSEPDRGQTHALNKGVARSSGMIVGWLNSDDLMHQGTLAHVIELFSARPDARWLIGRCDIVDATGRPVRRLITTYKNRRLRTWKYERLLVDNFISQPAVFMRRELLTEMGPFDEGHRYDMDYEYWLRVGRSYEPLLTNRVLASFRMYGTSKSGGEYSASLRSAHETARRFAREIGKPWLGWLNYWYFYRGATAIYHAMRLSRRILRRGLS